VSVRIRLRRTGANKLPFYRIVAVDSRSSPKGKFIENLGWYDPRGKIVKANKEKIKTWIGKGGELSNSVRKLLINYSVFHQNELPEK